MTDEITLKFKIKEKIESYNNNQKALYYNSFILKGFSVLLITTFTITLLFFIIPLITPFLLKTEIISDAIALTFSGCFFSIGITLFIVYKFITRKKKQAININNENYILNKTCPHNSNNDNLKTDDRPKFKKIKKRSLLLRIISLFEIIKELLSLLFSVLFSPIVKPHYIFLDQNKINFTIWLINELSKRTNYIIDEDYIINNYEKNSNTWFNNSFESLEKLEIIKTSKIDSKTKTIFLHLEFYNPELG